MRKDEDFGARRDEVFGARRDKGFGVRRDEKGQRFWGREGTKVLGKKG